MCNMYTSHDIPAVLPVVLNVTRPSWSWWKEREWLIVSEMVVRSLKYELLLPSSSFVVPFSEAVQINGSVICSYCMNSVSSGLLVVKEGTWETESTVDSVLCVLEKSVWIRGRQKCKVGKDNQKGIVISGVNLPVVLSVVMKKLLSVVIVVKSICCYEEPTCNQCWTLQYAALMLVSAHKSTWYYNVEDQHCDFISFFILFWTVQVCKCEHYIKKMLYSQEQNFTLCLKGF